MLAAVLLVFSQDEPADRGVKFHAPVPILADGRPIFVQGGHAAPVWADLDGDGAEELLVGQFRGGTASVYKHKGDRVFGIPDQLQAGVNLASVDYG